MANICIVTDTNSDLCAELREKYGIEYVKMCTVLDGQVTPADIDWANFSSKEFYDWLREGRRITTTQVPAGEFRTCFEEHLKAGDTVIYVGCALPLSSSVNTAAVVARDLAATYPDGKIYCVDTKMALLAAQLRNEGKSAEEIVATIEDRRAYVNQFVTVGSLDMLKRAGRVKGSAAFFGNLLGVKPIIISDSNGQNTPICKVKGRRTSLDKLVELMREAVIEPETQTLYIQHADCAEDAEYLREALAPLGFADVHITTIGPVVGACIGPGAIGVWAYGKKIETAV